MLYVSAVTDSPFLNFLRNSAGFAGGATLDPPNPHRKQHFSPQIRSAVELWSGAYPIDRSLVPECAIRTHLKRRKYISKGIYKPV